MDESRMITEVFAKADIEGMNFDEGIERFGGNAKLYVKIIRTFVDKIGAHLDTLSGLASEPGGAGKLEAYSIEVHGVKGSCYGISANKAGDMAKELEIASKAGNREAVLAGNDRFITDVKELAEKLRALLAELEGGGGGQKKSEPDKTLLAVMLQASRDFDVEIMQDTLKELEKYEYESGSDLVKWLSEQVTAFGYDRIEERLMAIL